MKKENVLLVVITNQVMASPSPNPAMDSSVITWYSMNDQLGKYPRKNNALQIYCINKARSDVQYGTRHGSFITFIFDEGAVAGAERNFSGVQGYIFFKMLQF